MHSDIQYQNRAYSKSNPIRLCTTHLISYCDALSFYCSSRWKSLDGWTWFLGSVGSPWHTRLCRVPSSWRASVRPSDRNGEKHGVALTRDGKVIICTDLHHCTRWKATMRHPCSSVGTIDMEGWIIQDRKWIINTLAVTFVEPTEWRTFW